MHSLPCFDGERRLLVDSSPPTSRLNITSAIPRSALLVRLQHLMPVMQAANALTPENVSQLKLERDR